MCDFKRTHTFLKRKEVSDRILSKFLDRLPVIVTPAPRCPFVLEKTKYLVPMDITVGKFLHELRRHVQIGPTQAMFLYVGNDVMPPTAALISQIYERFKDPDGFLYMVYAGEDTFG